MNKHIPAPWEVTEDRYYFNVGSPYFEPAAGHKMVEIPKGDIFVEQQKANAHLIASAPDLLEALKDLMEMAEDQARFIESEVLENVRGSLFNQDDVLDAKEKIERATAAIAKAEGKIK